ncbi:hypothetical protein A3C20_04395 [Candidatus Kaiserbacteria bacterium RIFCSPHIGHO2_02_FULL_55_25]|uniref:Aminoglycoside phosphotransferase domain-containing protein n=1 Tax=Candidatus Kaiserbacteria bacterium RIFCSPHIGHO2_02_FULL_55_25 TaxID=1798498 RepID=A0A1F6EAM0_9BACT|nr:MAG: hypothetical protein A2764_03820 [Candidatus Kaiserbacteria bacterium RIFCSPHIGHO2_01_FULL_55_79]OGG70733.1 MAG: hypothetical protein A3C20_04395 [Candidatus Kaiserbacteria bacterium RIFCSPHIGHO2_02_FULL_55_25]OGG77101.1 MAG: hypothetical protein A3F56_03075 [Candidatus Kaiserbacteria bacterium RIFCSPHIGHO2_12_FULL_55_13]OGG84036.1 MAG: hypothetical protein A3A42_03235 [Candidatus Kaiserbacteria bacterium RIFCSPLOWO2_01_FULL_55_25]
MEEHLIIEGKSFDLVSLQRSAAGVYRATDEYLRIGPPAQIAKDLEMHRAMERAGYPVAKILSEGTYEGHSYFIEESLGETFRMRFTKEYETSGAVSDATFDELVEAVGKYLEPQSKAIVVSDPEQFAKGIHLEILKQELPEYASRIQAKFEESLRSISDFPYVISHGDLNPSNISAQGVLDLEDSFPAPLGFDIASVLSTNEWFPESGDYEYQAKWKITDAQKSAYIVTLDDRLGRLGYSGFRANYKPFEFCRIIWMVVRMHKTPKIQEWRYQKMINEYL